MNRALHPLTIDALADMLDVQAAERARAEDVSAARSAVIAINAISRNDLTPQVFAHLLCVLSGTVERCPWNHTAEGEMVRNTLADLSDDLTA